MEKWSKLFQNETLSQQKPFSHVQSSGVALRFYPIFYLPLMSWNEGIFWACHQIFSSQKRLKPLSLALFSFVVHSDFFFTWICHKKASYLIEVEMSTTSIVAAATKEGLFLCGASSKRLFQKRTNFSWNPRTCFIQTALGSKLPMVNNHGVANNLIVIFFTF